MRLFPNWPGLCAATRYSTSVLHSCSPVSNGPLLTCQFFAVREKDENGEERYSIESYQTDFRDGSLTADVKCHDEGIMDRDTMLMWMNKLEAALIKQSERDKSSCGLTVDKRYGHFSRLEARAKRKAAAKAKLVLA